MKKPFRFVLGVAALLLAGCGERQEDPKPRAPQIAAEDYEDIVTCGDLEGPDIEPPISDEELAELKRAYLAGEAAAPRTEARAEVEQVDEHFC